MNRSHLMLGLSVLAGAILMKTAREIYRRQGRRKLKEDEQRWVDEGGQFPQRDVPETTGATT